MANIWIFQPQRDIQFIKEDAYEYELSLPSDTYEFFTYIRKSKHHFILIYKKDIHVFSDTTIHVSVNEGNVFTEFKFFREDNSPLRVNTFGFYYLLEPKSLLGVAFNHLNLDSTSFILQYNDLPDYFHNSWLVRGKQDWNRDNVYLINNYLAESAKDTLISNDPRNYAYADITYHFPDSIYHNGSMIQVATLAPAYNYFPNDRLIQFHSSFAFIKTPVQISHYINLDFLNL
jgi:hypothetical protein